MNIEHFGKFDFYTLTLAPLFELLNLNTSLISSTNTSICRNVRLEKLNLQAVISLYIMNTSSKIKGLRGRYHMSRPPPLWII